MTTLIHILLAFIEIKPENTISQPPNTDHQYRAAKYSKVVDYSLLQDIVHTVPFHYITYVYYVQYGNSHTVEIRDPGETPFLPTMLISWDYQSCTFTPEVIFDDAMKYYKRTDSMLFSIEDSRCIVKSLCKNGGSSGDCDSLKLIKQTSNEEYIVYLSDTISNIASYKLFYPDIQYLPHRIMRNGKSQSTLILDEIIYGKQAVDSLLQLYQREGYERISDEEWKSSGQRLPQEDKDLLRIVQDRLKE
ncbi:MAG TPA: hypothetical protein VLA46_06730 [Saprospiraceae bacterium]|nr:hypothetical protein [Saprospiraceae bacterium]